MYTHKTPSHTDIIMDEHVSSHILSSSSSSNAAFVPPEINVSSSSGTGVSSAAIAAVPTVPLSSYRLSAPTVDPFRSTAPTPVRSPSIVAPIALFGSKISADAAAVAGRLKALLPTFIHAEQSHSSAAAAPVADRPRPPSATAVASALLRSQSSPAKVSRLPPADHTSAVFTVSETLTNRFTGSNPSSASTTVNASDELHGRAPQMPTISVDSSPHSNTDSLALYENKYPMNSTYSVPKSVCFDNSLDCSDAFGRKISTEHLPGTPMEPNDLIGSDPTPPLTATERRQSLTVGPNNHIGGYVRDVSPPTAPHQPPTAGSQSLASSTENCSIPMETPPSLNHVLMSHNHNNNAVAPLGKRPSLAPSEKQPFGDSRKNSKQDREGLDPESLMFHDGRRKIDMVLCYEEEEEGVMTEQEARRRDTRRVFLESLVREGLELELEDRSQSFDEKTYFVKVHMPWKTETRYAEVMNLKLPIKRFITISVKAWDDSKKDVLKLNTIRRWMRKFNKLIDLDPLLMENEPTFESATAGGTPEEQFIVKDRCTTYTSAQRSALVMQILLRAKFDDTEKSGIRRMLNEGTFLACFPLHEGRYDQAHTSGATFDRRTLYLEWARPIKCFKRQPLCLIRKYFGDKIGLYFCWLGFYTQMLVWPAVVGTLCFIYGIASMHSDDNIPSAEICDQTGVGNITLCPLCDKACDYQKLSNSCLFAKITYLFDNPSTVFFAIFMSFWATTFLEMWKRKQSVLCWEWDLQQIEADEENRPEFEASVKTFRTNPVTREKEPYMPTWSRAARFVASGSTVLFMICIVLAAVLGTIIYRISVVAVIYGGGNEFVKQHAKIFTTITAATINLIIIMILTRIYHRIAIKLTNMENPRTHTEYEDSYTFKIFFFEFMNFYSSLIYIAFFKGRFYDHPGDEIARKSEFYRLKGDICDPAGCLSELCIQLAIIFVGKQVWNNFMEYLFPVFWNWWRHRKHKKQTKDETHLHMSWEEDYHMQDPGRLALFDEYLEMILQYGFVTLFVAAFPLAPLFALLNNIAEIRLDAFKMVTQARRPLAERVEDIGAWYGILRIITYTAVVSNAFVIAYTSDYIPRMVYKYGHSANVTLTGYIDHSLSEFNTSHYKSEWRQHKLSDPDVCQYRGYRNGPNDKDPYDLSSLYWHVFAARLAFVVAFEHVVFVLTGIMQFLIPDIPVEVKTQIQREQLLAKEAKYQNGLKKAQETEYNDLLQSLQRDQLNDVTSSSTPMVPGGISGGGVLGRPGAGGRGSFMRRMSRMSDGLDAHVEIAGKRRNTESTVWEVT